jgi:hypothetical protein
MHLNHLHTTGNFLWQCQLRFSYFSCFLYFLSCLFFLLSSLLIFAWALIAGYRDWLRAGRPRSRNSSPDREKNFLFSTSSRPALGPTQPLIQWVPGALSPGVKRPRREADHSPPCRAQEYVGLYIRLHGIVLNYTGKTLPLVISPSATLHNVFFL